MGFVVAPSRGLEARELAARLLEYPIRQLQPHPAVKRLEYIRLGLQPTAGIQQKAHAPVAFRVALRKLVQGIVPRLRLPRMAEVLRRLRHAGHVQFGMPRLPVLQQEGFENIEGLSGPFQKCPLLAPFGPFTLGGGSCRDAAANAAPPTGAANGGGSDGHVESGHTTGPHHTDRAAIHTARLGLQRANLAHRLKFGGTRHGTARKQRGKNVAQLHARPGPGGDVRRHLPHRGPALHVEQRRHLHGMGQRHARDVVAQQVDDHHVLGAVLFRALQSLFESLIVNRM